MPAAASATPAGGDRRIVTALFADVVEFARLVDESDPEDVQRQMDAALAGMDEAIRRFGGSREKFIGDAVFAVFGHPRAHDDDALRAGLCALAIRALLAGDRAHDSPPALQVRIGIATGEVVAADRDVPGQPEVAFTGPAVVRASRIQGVARPGEIVIDDATVRTLRGRLVVEPRGSELLRGQEEPVALFAIRGEHGLVPPSPRSVGLRMVGRTQERVLLREAIEETLKTSRGRAIVVRGDAGIGKTRLLVDLEADAAAAGFAWTWADNVSFGTEEPYRFARVFAQAIADEQGTDSGTMTRRLLFQPEIDSSTFRRLAGAIAGMARDASFSGWESEARWAPSDPAELNATLQDVASRYVGQLMASFGPRVVVVDDLQWIDRSSSGLLEAFVAACRDAPLLVLATTRPGPLPPWIDTNGLDWLDLGGLAADETALLAADVAGAALAAGDARLVHGRTAGNPLFVAETVRALLDDGALALRDGQLELLERPEAHAVPVSLRAVLGARIDALTSDAREALGVASVVGDTFADDVVAELLGGRPVHVALDRLARAALVVPVDARRTWRFGHVLIRDAAYAGMLSTRRRELHARLAEILERDRWASPTLLARHRIAAGQHQRAIPHLVAASDAALAVGAIDEAAISLRQAADLADDAEQAAGFRQRADELMVTGSTPSL
ncbi:MAG TPA: adenylate/guanylate cyclase domain-containing protein [Candidatus Limnocylindrales bacterium]